MTVVAPERIVTSGGAPKRRSKIVAVLVVLVLGLASWVVVDRLTPAAVPDGWTRVASLEQVRSEGVVSNLSVNVHVVYDESAGKPIALSAVNPHTSAAPQPVLYCQSSGWFEDPRFGSKFDRFGRYGLGPAPRGLDQVAVLVLSDDVYVDPTQVIPGPARFDPKPLERIGPFCGEQRVETHG